MSLFKSGQFKLHSGGTSDFKTDCDALTEEDWRTVAEVARRRFRFGDVIDIPDGGSKLAAILSTFREEDHPLILIVDDVLTTGASFEKIVEDMNDKDFIRDRPIQGFVVFARGPCPDWVWPLFVMNGPVRKISYE